LAIDPTHPHILCASIDTYGYAKNGAYKSTNSGEDWEEINPGIEDLGISYLAIHPTTPATLYGVAGGNKVAKTTDGGGHWSVVAADLPGTDQYAIDFVAIDPSTPDTVYVGTRDYGLYKSADGGGQWKKIFSGKIDFQTLTIDPETPSILSTTDSSHGVYKSTDAGETWNSFDIGLPKDR
jgi:photosystem II stability/assembly factor-like uncharacterized protein